MSSVFIVAIIINAMFSEMTAAASLFDQGYQFPKTGKSHKILKKLKAIHSQPETPPIPCPTESHKSIFIWVIGQSNAGNSVGHRFESETSLVFFQGHCYVAMDPMLGNYGKSGSVWLPMLDKLASATNKKPIVKATVVGGSKIQHWVNPDALKPFYKFHALQLKKFGISPDFILFIQGESNRARKHEKTYYPNLKEFIELIKKDFPLSIIGLSKTSYTKGNIGAHVRAAQEKIIQDLGLLYLGDTDKFDERRYRYDNVHFSQQGANAVAEMFSSSILHYMSESERTDQDDF